MRCAWVLIISACILSGCGSGVDRYTVSGTATYRGQPIPSGYVRFEPDTSKGNRGPGAGAQVKDGYFTTGKEQGVVGGPYQVTIYGLDGMVIRAKDDEKNVRRPKPLFPDYKLQFDFPRSDFEWNIEVPDS